jgi:hypothetical protein
MSATTQRLPARETSAWTPARIFMAISALFHIPVGFAGFITDRTFPIGAHATARARSGHVFGVFETNGWHTLGALIVGVVSLYFALRPNHAREGALGLGAGHVGLWVALVLWDPSTFWLASNGADQIVHSITAVGGIGSGLLTKPGVRGTGMDRAGLVRAGGSR